MIISSVVCFTDTSGSLDAIKGVSGIFRVVRLRVGGGNKVRVSLESFVWFVSELEEEEEERASRPELIP